MSALDLRRLGRLGGAGLVVGGIALFVLMALPHWEADESAVTVTVAVAAIFGGLAAMRARWTSDATRAGMVLAAGAYLGLGCSAIAGGSQAAYGPLFVVVAAWCGLALGPSYPLKLAPLALVCNTLPALLGHSGTWLTGVGAVVVATVTGEIFARLADRVRRDSARDANRTQALERLTSGQLELARAATAQQAASIAAAVARDILDAGDTAVLVDRDGTRIVLGGSARRIAPPGEWSGEPPLEVPLSGRGGSGVRGALLAYPRPGERLDPFGQTLVTSLAAATSAALENIALTQRLRVRAEVDPLTGLGNRRRLATALSRLQPGDVVIALDLDLFKQVNDTLGHDAGDAVLRAFGAHLTRLTRAGELAIRTGGEEFVLIVEGGADARGAAALLSRLATEWWRQTPLTTFSAGAAVHHGGDPAATLTSADQALYEAKRRGRAAAWLVTQGGATAAGRLLPFPGRPFSGQAPLSQIILPPAAPPSDERDLAHAADSSSRPYGGRTLP